MTADVIQDVLISAFNSQMQNLYTAIPCIVVSVRDGQMVDIQPTINQKFKDGTVKERPVILGVPVSFPVSRDTGLAIFSMRSMDSWKGSNGRPVSPTNFAKMDKGDAIFLPGIQPPSVAVNSPGKHVLTHATNDVVMFANLGSAECEVRLKADGSIEINTSNQPVTINCSDATVNASDSINLNAVNLTVDATNSTWIGPINHTGNYTGVGVQTFNGVIFSTHRHAPSTVPPSN
jgi:hypothetical protein